MYGSCHNLRFSTPFPSSAIKKEIEPDRIAKVKGEFEVNATRITIISAMSATLLQDSKSRTYAVFLKRVANVAAHFQLY